MNTDEIPFKNGSIRFQLVNPLFLTNKNVTISSMYADFGNGNQSISFGNIITANFSAGGIKTIKFTINFSNSVQVITYSNITISSATALRFGMPVNPDSGPTDIKDINYGFQGYDEIQKFYNTGKYSIYYHRNTPGGPIENIVKKPIIIIDGFDPVDSRDETLIFGRYLAYSSTQNFGNDMRDKGYDVIILNFPKVLRGTISIPLIGNYPVYA